MLHETPLIATLTLAFVGASVFGLIAGRLRLPPILGYLLAGVALGPSTPGFTANPDLAAELAEIGVILLMFGVGLHFSYRDLMKVQSIALPGAIAQMAIATLLGTVLGLALGWPLSGGLAFGLALSVASTVVLVRALEERQLLDTRSGHIAVGWLVIEDLAMVAALVFLPVIAGALPGGRPDLLAQHGGVGLSLSVTLGKLVAFIALMLLVGRRLIPWVLARVASLGSRELFTLTVLGMAVGIAYAAAKLFDVSFALGAFAAGMILKESELSHKAGDNILPLRDAFAVLFFVSVGMLFKPATLVDRPLAVLATLLTIVVGKSIAALLIVRAFRHPADTALLIAASLAQIGEFSFILTSMALSLRILPEEARDLVVAGAIGSILLNPAVFSIATKMRARRLGRTPIRHTGHAALGVDIAAPHQSELADHVVLVGHGRVGRRIKEALKHDGVKVAVVDSGIERVEALRREGEIAILGNATREEVLRAAGVSDAACLILAIPNGFESGEIVARARAINRQLRIVARAHSDGEIDHLIASGADRVVMGEYEIARCMVADLREAGILLPAKPGEDLEDLGYGREPQRPQARGGLSRTRVSNQQAG